MKIEHVHCTECNCECLVHPDEDDPTVFRLDCPNCGDYAKIRIEVTRI